MGTTGVSDTAMWSPSSWRKKPIVQQPDWESPSDAEAVWDRIRSLPPLLFSGEIDRLKKQLAEAQAGRAFLLQGGDCAERFIDVSRDKIVRKVKILLQMSLVMAHAARKPIVVVGRIGGQFAKPRSQPFEIKDGVQLPSYRGDLINRLEPTPEARRPDPERMIQAYFHSAATVNFIRALVDGGYADLDRAAAWQLGFMQSGRVAAAYKEIAERIHDAIDFIASLDTRSHGLMQQFYTSHEALVLGYEEAFTTKPPQRDAFYNLGAHFLWAGDRTRQIDGAHVEYLRGIANPIGVKVGPSCTDDELERLIDILDPTREPGRLTLIARYGRKKVDHHLPHHIRAAKRAGSIALWSCDPMHGNAVITERGIKTRNFDDILHELRTNFEVHRAEGSRLGAVHVELTGDNVTECIGGSEQLSESDLLRNYETGLDPRLNYAQSLEMAFLIAEHLEKDRTKR